MKRQGRQCNLCAEILYISVFLISLKVHIVLDSLIVVKQPAFPTSWQQLGHLKRGELSSFIYHPLSKLARKS